MIANSLKSRSLYYLFQFSKHLLSDYYEPKALPGAVHDREDPKISNIVGDKKEK